MVRNLLAAALLAPLLSAPLAAAEYATYGLIEFMPAAAPAPSEPRITLATLPASWSAGDAAVILLGPRGESDPLHQRLIAGLLDTGAAIVELRPAATADETLGDLFGVLASLRGSGAGLVVALGHGAAGDAALLALQDAEAARRLGPEGQRFTAAARLGPAPVFALGTLPSAREYWPMRVTLLCRRLAELLAEPGPPAEGAIEACLTGFATPRVTPVAALAADPARSGTRTARNAGADP